MNMTRQPRRSPLPTRAAPRRRWLRALACSAVASLLPGVSAARSEQRVLVKDWKHPSCGCCTDWIRHLQANGLATKLDDSGNTAMRARLGIAARYGSCHTALVGGYAIEGHVPASEIKRLLAERPNALGLAVPRMPVGSPGMDGEVYGGRKDPYDVLLLARDGSASVYRSYR